jgi:hypothetical protein
MIPSLPATLTKDERTILAAYRLAAPQVRRCFFMVIALGIIEDHGSPRLRLIRSNPTSNRSPSTDE